MLSDTTCSLYRPLTLVCIYFKRAFTRTRQVIPGWRPIKSAAPRTTAVTYNFKPRDPDELFHNVEQVEDEQDPREPEAAHGHGIEPSSPAVVAVSRHRYAYKSQEI